MYQPEDMSYHSYNQTPQPYAEQKPHKVYMRTAKPPYSYLGLAVMAIQLSSSKKLHLNEIIERLYTMFAYFRKPYSGWKSSVRHTLSRYDCFVKSFDPCCPRRSLWSVDLSKVPKTAFRRQETDEARNGNYAFDLHEELGVTKIILPSSVESLPLFRHLETQAESVSPKHPLTTTSTGQSLPSETIGSQAEQLPVLTEIISSTTQHQISPTASKAETNTTTIQHQIGLPTLSSFLSSSQHLDALDLQQPPMIPSNTRLNIPTHNSFSLDSHERHDSLTTSSVKQSVLNALETLQSTGSSPSSDYTANDVHIQQTPCSSSQLMTFPQFSQQSTGAIPLRTSTPVTKHRESHVIVPKPSTSRDIFSIDKILSDCSECLFQNREGPSDYMSAVDPASGSSTLKDFLPATPKPPNMKAKKTKTSKATKTKQAPETVQQTTPAVDVSAYNYNGYYSPYTVNYPASQYQQTSQESYLNNSVYHNQQSHPLYYQQAYCAYNYPYHYAPYVQDPAYSYYHNSAVQYGNYSLHPQSYYYSTYNQYTSGYDNEQPVDLSSVNHQRF